ncbi:hypothetical protein JKI95_06610 [Corynebacterium aquatimens]|uniref:Mu transposase domain-containing protein n=1 Tax=Corynebacterium aquatimens TaxID=1190508 RepID=UPI0025408842|nr:hypothetical protein [Corynebacterium aquatimens]QYH18984.1 hypothetical protein JKI95_06610 [Corynebacterium aquatimens]
MRFNPVRFDVRRTDKTGVVTLDGNRYLVGPAWANRQVTLELSHDTVTVLDDDTRRIIALPRVFGTADSTVINPMSLLPGLAKNPGRGRTHRFAITCRTLSWATSTGRIPLHAGSFSPTRKPPPQNADSTPPSPQPPHS